MHIILKKDKPWYIAKLSSNKSIYGFGDTPLQAVQYLIENYSIWKQVDNELSKENEKIVKNIDYKKLRMIFENVSFNSLSVKI